MEEHLTLWITLIIFLWCSLWYLIDSLCFDKLIFYNFKWLMSPGNHQHRHHLLFQLWKFPGASICGFNRFPIWFKIQHWEIRNSELWDSSALIENIWRIYFTPPCYEQIFKIAKYWKFLISVKIGYQAKSPPDIYQKNWSRGEEGGDFG